ncbi:MAG TPA: cytochrome c [Sphingobacteriaceae bacterium]|nr:cytochrome c [Sphingobacteriaceae bacterium]
MKRSVRILSIVFAAALVLVILLTTYLFTALPNVGQPEEIEVQFTPEKVARGEYLAYHVMMCADCHSSRDFSLFSGPPSPGTEFVGGDVFDHSMGFPGQFVSSNITPFGVGDWSDGELYRLITTGVKKNGDPIFPVMPYHSFGKLDPADIRAVIAYLRTLDPVETNHPESKADFPFNLIMRTIPQPAEPGARPDTNQVVDYGKYMVTAASCFDCHTNFQNNKPVGPAGGGGREFQFPDGSVVRSSNLTPHETGIGSYTKESFVERFKMYADSAYVLSQVRPGEFQTLMPWYMYSGMTEQDLGAIYEYLNTLEPYNHAVVKYSPAEP